MKKLVSMKSLFVFQLEGTLKILHEEANPEKLDPIEINTVNLTLVHKSDGNVLHKLAIAFVSQSNKAVSRDKKSDQLKFQLDVIHTNKEQKLWLVRLQHVDLYLYEVRFFLLGIFK